jgi:hygromycin-B 4-O-kinase
MDTESLLKALAAAGFPVAGLTALASGTWSMAWSGELGGERVVVRVANLRADFDKDALVAAMAIPNVPCAPILGIGPLDDRWWALSRWMPGEPFETHGGAAWERLGPDLAGILGSLAAVTPSGPGWGSFDANGRGTAASWRDHLLSVAADSPDDRMAGRLEKVRSHPRAAKLFERYLANLDGVASDAVPRALIHGDLLNRNVLAHDGRISAVLDWGCAAWGDPLYDVAWLRFMDAAYADLDLEATATQLLAGAPGEGERLTACLLHIGLDHLAFNAFHGRDDMIAAVEARMEELC